MSQSKQPQSIHEAAVDIKEIQNNLDWFEPNHSIRDIIHFINLCKTEGANTLTKNPAQQATNVQTGGVLVLVQRIKPGTNLFDYQVCVPIYREEPV